FSISFSLRAFKRRCNVRIAESLGNCSGCASISLSIISREFKAGSSSSHESINGQACSKGSFLVRHQRGDLGALRCVGRASPLCHRLASPLRKCFRSSSLDVASFFPRLVVPCCTIFFCA